jgi:hypothetical protein
MVDRLGMEKQEERDATWRGSKMSYLWALSIDWESKGIEEGTNHQQL